MNAPTFNDFASIALSHEHGSFFTEIDAKTQTSTLGRHVIRRTTEQENVQARRAFFNAIAQSGYLDGQLGALAVVRQRLGIGADGSVDGKPLALREVRALVEDVRRTGQGTLALLLDLGFSHEDVSLLRKWMPKELQAYYVDAFADVRKTGNPGDEVRLLVAMRDKLKSARISERLQSGLVSGDVNALTPYLAQKCYEMKAVSPSLDARLVVAVLKRHLDDRTTTALAARRPGQETAEALQRFVADCLDEAVALAMRTDELNETLWQDANDHLVQCRANLPANGHLVGLEDVVRYQRDRMSLFTSGIELSSFDAQSELETLAADVRGSFLLGMKHLLEVTQAPDGKATEAEVRVRTRKFTEETFEKYSRTKLGVLDLPAFDDSRLCAAICQRRVDEAMGDWASGSSLADAFSWTDMKLEGEVRAVCDNLELLADRRSAEDPFVARELEARLGALGLGDGTEEDRAAVRSLYERLYARDVVANCGDPGLHKNDALDEATRRVVKEAVDGLLAAKVLAEGVRHRLEDLPAVRAFRAGADVTEQMRAAFDAFEDGLVQRVRVQLTSNASGETIEILSAQSTREVERKIGELQAARRRHLRAHVSERYQAIRDDFDAKFPSVEAELAEFETTLEPLAGKFGREMMSIIVPKAEFSGIHDMWTVRCDELRARYETEPKDFDPNKPDLARFNDTRFLRAMKQELAEAWRTRGDVYVGAVNEIEDYLRGAGFPEGVGLTTGVICARQGVPEVQSRVADVVPEVQDAVFKGDTQRVRELLDGFKSEVGRLIAEHNRKVFTVQGGVDSTGVRSLHTYAQIAFGRLRAKESILSPRDGFEASMFEAGYREVRRAFGEDAAHYHTEEELVVKMKELYDQVVVLWDRMSTRVHQRIVDRAETHLYEIPSSVSEDGTFRANFHILITQDVAQDLVRLFTDEQKRMVVDPLGYDAEEAMRTRIDVAVDRIIERAMAPTAEQRRVAQSMLVERARASLASQAELLTQQMKPRWGRPACPKEVLLAAALQYTADSLAHAMEPVAAVADGRIHAPTFRAPDVEALKKGLAARLKEVAAKF